MTSNRYQAILFSPDGDWVTDFKGCKTVDEVWENLSDMGSRWIFYPIPAVILDKGVFTSNTQRIVDANTLSFKGLSIKTVSRILRGEVIK